MHGKIDVRPKVAAVSPGAGRLWDDSLVMRRRGLGIGGFSSQDAARADRWRCLPSSLSQRRARCRVLRRGRLQAISHAAEEIVSSHDGSGGLRSRYISPRSPRTKCGEPRLKSHSPKSVSTLHAYFIPVHLVAAS
jgi:hypothetical protein